MGSCCHNENSCNSGVPKLRANNMTALVAQHCQVRLPLWGAVIWISTCVLYIQGVLGDEIKADTEVFREGWPGASSAPCSGQCGGWLGRLLHHRLHGAVLRGRGCCHVGGVYVWCILTMHERNQEIRWHIRSSKGPDT